MWTPLHSTMSTPLHSTPLHSTHHFSRCRYDMMGVWGSKLRHNWKIPLKSSKINIMSLFLPIMKLRCPGYVVAWIFLGAISDSIDSERYGLWCYSIEIIYKYILTIRYVLEYSTNANLHLEHLLYMFSSYLWLFFIKCNGALRTIIFPLLVSY